MDLVLSEEAWNQAVKGGDLEKIGQYLGLVSTGLETLRAERGLLLATSLWQGLKRPCNHDREASEHRAYTLTPNKTLTWSRDLSDLRSEPAPRDAVFMVTVWTPAPEGPQVHGWTEAEGRPIAGEIQDWTWVTADSHRADQPSTPNHRFFEHLW